MFELRPHLAYSESTPRFVQQFMKTLWDLYFNHVTNISLVSTFHNIGDQLITNIHLTGDHFITNAHDTRDQFTTSIHDNGDHLITNIQNTGDQFAAEINAPCRTGSKY